MNYMSKALLILFFPIVSQVELPNELDNLLATRLFSTSMGMGYFVIAIETKRMR